MKLSKIRKALSKHIIELIWDRNGNEWIGDGTVFYVLDDGLKIDRDNALPILDVEMDDRKDWDVIELHWEHRGTLDIVPNPDCEDDMAEVMRIVMDKTEMIVLRTETGESAMIPAYQVKPCEGKEALGYTLRRAVDSDTGEFEAPVVCVYTNMLCCAVIMPMGRSCWDAAMNRMEVAGATSYCYEEEEKNEHDD